MPFKEIYVREQGKSKFSFFVDEKQCLIACMEREGVRKKMAVVLPKIFLQEVTQEKIPKILAMLEQSSFDPVGGRVFVNARGEAGWGVDVHRGFYFGSTLGVKAFTDALDSACIANPADINRVGIPTIPKTKYGEGTYVWAVNNFEFSIADAVAISDACMSVDYGLTSPLNVFEPRAQGWHFNVNFSIPNGVVQWRGNQLPCKAGGSSGDSRIIHAAEMLALACTFSEEGQSDEALKAVGAGLHPLQDVYAHADQFVTRVTTNMLGFTYLTHANRKGKHADDIFSSDGDPAGTKSPEKSQPNDPASTIDFYSGGGGKRYNQRYSNAKTASLLYMLTFLHLSNHPIGTKVAKESTSCGKHKENVVPSPMTYDDRRQFLDQAYLAIKKDRLLHGANLSPFLGLFDTLNKSGLLARLPACDFKNDVQRWCANIQPQQSVGRINDIVVTDLGQGDADLNEYGGVQHREWEILRDIMSKNSTLTYDRWLALWRDKTRELVDQFSAEPRWLPRGWAHITGATHDERRASQTSQGGASTSAAASAVADYDIVEVLPAKICSMSFFREAPLPRTSQPGGASTSATPVVAAVPLPLPTQTVSPTQPPLAAQATTVLVATQAAGSTLPTGLCH